MWLNIDCQLFMCSSCNNVNDYGKMSQGNFIVCFDAFYILIYHSVY